MYRDPNAICAVEGCERKQRLAGYCGMHHQRLRVKGEVGQAEPIRRQPSSSHVCSVEGCERAYYARNFCQMHYDRARKFGDPGPVHRLRTPPGEGTPRPYAHVWVKELGRSVPEHRVIMERHIGRELFRDETVHHKNGDRKDNRIQNLELWTNRHPSGQRVSDQIEWAREILRRYDKPQLAFLLNV